MASGPTVGGDGARERRRYIEGKVYRRKVFKGTKKNPNVGDTVVSTAATTNEDNAPTTTVTNDTDNKNYSTVENINADETKSNTENVLAPLPAVSGDGNLAQPEGSSRFQPLESSRLEDGNLPQKQLEEQNLEHEQVSLRTGDGNSPQKQLEDQDLEQEQVSLRTGGAGSPQHQLEDQNLGRQQVSSRTGDENSPHQQFEDQNSAQPHVSSRTEDRNSPQPQTNSRQEEGDSPLPQENSRQTEDGNTAQLELNSRLEDVSLPQPELNSRLEDGSLPQPELNSAQPELNSRLEDVSLPQPELNSTLEDGSLPQPELNSTLEDGSLPQPELSSRLEDGNLPQPELNSKLEDRTSQQQDNPILEDGNLPQPQVSLRLEDSSLLQPPVNSTLEDRNLAQSLSPSISDYLHSHQQAEPSNLNVQQEDDGPSSPISMQEVVPSTGYLPSVNVPVEPCLEDRIKINLALTSKQEKQEIRWKLESELDVVRSLVKRIEVKQGQVGGYGHSNVVLGGGIANGGGGKRAHSEVASAGVSRQPTRPLYQLSLSMLHNSQGGSENVEKEKRTPKANQFYHNSEFLLAKDKFPPAESNKKSKLSWKKQGGGEMGHGLRMGSKFFKSCSSLLEKLMKHKHAWVFNSPVDVEGLGLHDYFTIITHPMDLGTVKNRLNKNWYKSPKEFAEDVRLTFNNAMTYNPKGQDVHVMAEHLSKIFEDRWAIIESDYNREIRYGMEYGAAPPAPSHLSRRVPAFTPPALDMRRILDRSESLAQTPRPMNITPSNRTPAPKKPKAKDPHKRDMTFDEKQKLSTNLQSLPPEKLDAIVQIIKRRNLALNQHDDEIEVDIDSVDAETLWELDRFVTNYKKSLSKNKRRAELARARAEALQNSIQRSQPPAMVEIPRETQADERNVPPSLPMQGGNQADNRSRSSSSSSSSSDSGSSSSDSDSDSSSASSDAGSQGT